MRRALYKTSPGAELRARSASPGTFSLLLSTVPSPMSELVRAARLAEDCDAHLKRTGVLYDGGALATFSFARSLSRYIIADAQVNGSAVSTRKEKPTNWSFTQWASTAKAISRASCLNEPTRKSLVTTSVLHRCAFPRVLVLCAIG